MLPFLPFQPSMSSVVESEKSSSDYVAERLVRLVSVGLKEATMDSPSFRASINFTHISILQCNHHLEQSLIILRNYMINLNNFINSNNDITNLFKPYINDLQFINNDVSKPCINKFLNGQDLIFKHILTILSINENSINLINQLLDIELTNYFILRKNFENIQNKYDIVLAKFMQLPKGYDSNKSREDALQLFEIRKQYINISMTLWIIIKQLENKISKVVTEISNSFWNNDNTTSPIDNTELYDAIGLSDIIYSIKQLNLYADLQSNSNNLLINDLNRARQNSEEGAIKMYTPSSDLKDFDPSTLSDDNILLNNNNSLLEKHGWVFIKSQKLNSKGEVWIKRWMFIKNGVFGFLSISQDGQYVQESDKIGVLLINIKYLPSEDRKFCFKIQSDLTNLNIQVETINDLKSWLTVFNNNQILAKDENNLLATKRYPPLLNLLKLQPVVAKDLELINVLPMDSTIEKTQKLIEIQLSNSKFNLSINPPLKTSMTEKLSMSHLYLSSTIIPSATTANFWGYVNWGLYFVIDDEHKEKILSSNKNIEPKILINLRYPKFYPENLRVADAELRSIFEVFVNDNNEYTLLRFNASWSPNSDQTLFCTIYLTNHSYYVYSHTCGLISLLPIPLSSVLDVEILKKGEKNILKIFFVNGLSLKMQLFADNMEIVKNKINYILDNNKANNPDSFNLVINKLGKIEENELKFKLNSNSKFISKFKSIDNELINENIDEIKGINSTIQLSNNTNETRILSDMDIERKINYTPEMHLLLIKKIKLPSKALFHMLFGDESILLQGTLPLASSIFKDDHLKHSLWRCNSKQKLSRVVWNSIFKVPCALQTIERIDNNKYYNIVQETPYLRFVFGINRKIIMRFIIYNVDSKTSKLMIYYNLGDENSNVLNWFTRKVTHQIMLFRIEALEKKLDESIRQIINSNKKISMAIQLFGPITKYDSDEMTKEEGLFEKSVYFVPLQLFSTFYCEKLNFEFERFIVHSITTIKRSIKLFFKFINANLILFSVFFFSIILNFILIGKSSTSYWREKNINNHLRQITGDNYLMERSIGIREIDEMIYPNSTDLSFSNEGSEVYWKFLKQENLLYINEFSKIDGNKYNDKYDILRGEREILLSQKLTGLRMERNEILSKLNLLNYLEREFIIKEWTDWVSSEISNCERVKEFYPESFESIKDYCNETETEMKHLYQTLL